MKKKILSRLIMSSTPKVTVLASLYRCEKYLASFLEHMSALKHTDEIEVLLLHNDPQPEELEIITTKLTSLSYVKHVNIPERESLYKTWNRGINIAQGEYICVWNVDDIRLPNSIHEQATTLDENPTATLTYGDFYYMYEYGVPSDDLVVNPDFETSPKAFLKAHHIGCFPMWRKSLHEEYGYFDEQLRLVADLDFQIRLSLDSKLVKTKSLMGYYLENEPGKLSMNYSLQLTERTLLYLRYAVFNSLNWFFIPQTLARYSVNEVKYGEGFKAIVLPKFFRIKRLPLLLISTVKQPRYFLTFLKHEILGK